MQNQTETKRKNKQLNKTNRQKKKKVEQSSYQWFDARTGLSFCAMWYKALIAFILNKGGFLSARQKDKQKFKIKKTLTLPGSLCRAIRINHNTEFLPTPELNNWTEKGLILLGQMFENRVLLSFQQLQHMYDLPNQDLFKYLQLRH